MKRLSIFLSLVAFTVSYADLYGQPYHDTYVQNKYVQENTFINGKPDTSTPPAFNEIREKLPVPVWPNRPDVIKMYWRTWELAIANIRKVSGSQGLITPYIDPAFNNNIFTEKGFYGVILPLWIQSF